MCERKKMICVWCGCVLLILLWKRISRVLPVLCSLPMFSNTSHCLHAKYHLDINLFGLLIYSKAKVWICGGFLHCIQCHFPWYSVNTWINLKAPQRDILRIPHRKASMPRTNCKVSSPNWSPALSSHPTCVYLTALLPSPGCEKEAESQLQG